MINWIFSAICTTVMCASVFSQTEDKWELYKSIDGIEIYSQEVNCMAKNIPNQVAIIFKVVNTTDKEIKIEWDLAVWYNGVEQTSKVRDGEKHYTIELGANEIVIGDCEVPYGALYIYKDFITYKTDTKLSNYELQNIKVTRDR